MARKSRFFVKKRGHRRTGSAAVARIGEAAFFASLLIVGGVGLWAVLAWWVVPHWQADHDFVETVGIVLEKRVEEQTATLEQPLYRASFLIEYTANGEPRREWAFNASHDFSRDRERAIDTCERFERGSTYRCWYAPRQPTRVVLERGGSWWVWLTLVIPIPFLVLGAGGLVYTVLHWRTSSERRASLAARTADLTRGDASENDPLTTAPPPTVPDAGNLTNSPGTHLAYRLPMTTASSWRLVGAIGFCTLAAGVTVACVWSAISQHVEGKADWLLDLSLLPLAGVTAWAVSLVARQWTVSNAVGPTMVEVADHPLYPGRTYELFVLQSGRLDLEWLEVSLVCTEQASYQQGTDVRTETAVVWRERALRCERFRIDNDTAFQRKCLITIPHGAMHSFKAASNEVRWNIVVRGEAKAWPMFERSFQIVVYPKVAAGSGELASSATWPASNATPTSVAASSVIGANSLVAASPQEQES